MVVGNTHCIDIVQLQAMLLKGFFNGVRVVSHARVNNNSMAAVLHKSYCALDRLATVFNVSFYENVYCCHNPSNISVCRESIRGRLIFGAQFGPSAEHHRDMVNDSCSTGA